MPATEAQIAASRRNGQLSRGPRSLEGKAISSRNALKHGLAGEGAVLDDRDAAEVDRREAAMLADMKPASELGHFLVRRMARLAVRVEKASDRELAADAYLVAHAEEAFDEARLAEVEALLAGIAEAPGMASRRLRAMPEGVARMIEILEGLRQGLDDGAWDRASGEWLCHLTGVGWADPAVSGIRGLCLDVEAGDPSGRARHALATGLDAQVAMLRQHAETLDLDQIEADRASAPERAGFAPSKEALLARRYEAAATRELFKSLAEFRRVEAEAHAIAKVAPTDPTSPPAASGSFRAEAPRVPAPAPRTSQPAPSGPLATPSNPRLAPSQGLAPGGFGPH